MNLFQSRRFSRRFNKYQPRAKLSVKMILTAIYFPSTGDAQLCPGLLCEGSKIPNFITCSCDCPPTAAAACTGPLEFFNFDFCECLRHPCDPPGPCPEGENMDYAICDCVPDPNYSTTTSKRPPKSNESSKSRERSHEKHSKSDKKGRSKGKKEDSKNKGKKSK